MTIVRSRQIFQIILSGAMLSSSYGLKPSEFGSYNAPSFGQADPVSVSPQTPAAGDSWGDFQQQRYQEQVCTNEIYK